MTTMIWLFARDRGAHFVLHSSFALTSVDLESVTFLINSNMKMGVTCCAFKANARMMTWSAKCKSNNEVVDLLKGISFGKALFVPFLPSVNDSNGTLGYRPIWEGEK